MQNTLRKARDNQTLVRVEREIIEGSACWSDGYVIAMSNELVLLSALSEEIDFNGFEILRVSDISEVHNPAPHAEFQEKALQLKNCRLPASPSIALANIRVAIIAISETFPLITIHREKILSDECEIGRLASAEKDTFSLHTIDPNAEWNSVPEQFLYSDVTRITYSGGYENALALVAGLIQ